MPAEFVSERVYKHKPKNTAFTQQRLAAWRPTFSVQSVLPVFVIVSLAFIPLGVILLITSRSAVEYSYDYTDCDSTEMPSIKCSSIRLDTTKMFEKCTCRIDVDLDVRMEGDVYMYYGLEEFYQNHRRYVKSRDDEQLIGKHVAPSTVSSSCAPYDVLRTNESSRVFAPCGAIANSMFNDTFVMHDGATAVPFTRTGIAWESDHSAKFINPSPTNNLALAFSTYAKPLFWRTPVQYLDNTTDDNNGYKNEAFIVWMRAAAFPRFRKAYGKLNRTNLTYRNGLPRGSYFVDVSYNYPVTAFGGRKRLILATVTWFGGKNDFLGIAYIACGGFSLFMSGVLVLLHYIAGKANSVQTSHQTEAEVNDK